LGAFGGRGFEAPSTGFARAAVDKMMNENVPTRKQR